MSDAELSTQIHSAPAQALVPSGYAEKAMASLMQLHSELMEEKERRVDLYRRLMEKEQTVAELRMYVKLLEERLQRSAPDPAPSAAAPEPAAEAKAVVRPLRVAPAPTPEPAPVQAAAGGRAHPRDGWKTW